MHLVHQDAYKYLEHDSRRYDVVIVDLPDPNNEMLAKLYSVEFYRLVKHHLSAAGVLVAQATSPFYSRQSYWCVARSIAGAGLHVSPSHIYVPSFGDWGFVLAAPRVLHAESALLHVPTRYLTQSLLPTFFLFSKDDCEVPVQSSTLDHPAILMYYIRNGRRWE
jgi:spermidine synthase